MRTLDPIGATVAELGRRLPAPLRPAGLLAEIRDGLDDAAAAYRRAGLSPAEAADRAVADFGPIDEIVAESGDTAVAGFCRAAAYTLGLGYLVTMIGWLVLGVADPGGPAGMNHGPGPVTFWFGGLALAALVSAVLLSRHLRAGARCHRPALATVPLMICTNVVFCAVTLISAYLVSPFDPNRWVPGHRWTLLDYTETLSGAVQVIILLAALACLLAALRLRRATLTGGRDARMIRT
ncbi:permease prefix domain 1-containing protein [Microlunatus speluncae]|uniref:permease prefix domain 1-containing protein n=1 Tax=Microlunatus speluncae TaxID=2594267 RepID=UPI00126632B1|nr:permease prefix domain 1-containing protein [Microlunatus speluncae]